MIWYDKPIREVFALLETDRHGLGGEESRMRLSKYGENKLKEAKKIGFFERMREQLSDFMVITLICAAVISFLISWVEGQGDFADPIIILAIVAINAVLGVIQESRAEKAIEALQKLSVPHVRVRRGGEVVTVDCEHIVPGDVLLLETGDYIPADARIIKCTALKTEESALTGESLPQDKHDRAISGAVHIGDRQNMLFASTLIVSGHAEAVVVETGMHTEVGKIAQLIISDEGGKTPLQERLADIGKMLGISALSICGVIFVMGFFRSLPLFEMFMTSVSLAVAAIPEGLPAIVTIVLAIGVMRMSSKNAIIRKLPAVETLGSASVICSDKTGTLTQNKMSVVEIACDERRHALKLAAQCCNGSDPTERAILAAAGSVEAVERVLEIPFDSNRKLMTVVIKNGRNYRIITKGAPEILLKKCNLTEQERTGILTKNAEMAKKALRVLAVAFRDTDTLSQQPEHGLVFAGLIGTADPVRPEAEDAVRVCRRAGIKTVMITGDHIETASAVARELGILRGNDKAITGQQLAQMSQHQLEREIFGYSVFARVLPEDKLRIVKTYQSRGAVVAMTGDGVNDAPALKSADIGCAMGICGTDVAKGAADMVLADDNFATIVEAVRQGRGIYENIKKSVHFLLSSNIGEILTVFIAIFLGWPTPLVAIQLLWTNLVTDSLPAIALGVDDIDKEIMLRKPKSPKSGLFSDGLGIAILLEGCLIGGVSLLAFNIGLLKYDLTAARTMAFSVLCMSQLVHAFNIRNTGTVFSKSAVENKSLVFSFFLGIFMQVSIISLPAAAKLFKVTQLSFAQWQTVAVLCLVPLAVVEVQKFLTKTPELDTDKSPKITKMLRQNSTNV